MQSEYSNYFYKKLKKINLHIPTFKLNANILQIKIISSCLKVGKTKENINFEFGVLITLVKRKASTNFRSYVLLTLSWSGLSMPGWPRMAARDGF